MSTFVLILWMVDLSYGSAITATKIEGFPTRDSCEFTGKQFDYDGKGADRQHICLEIKDGLSSK